MTTLGNLDANGVGRYDESTGIGSGPTPTFSQYLNAILSNISSVITGLQPAACGLRLTANQNLTVAPAAVAWNFEMSDPRGMHSNTLNPSRITAPVAGLYEVVVSLYNNNTSGLGSCEARLNGGAAIPGSWDRQLGDSSGLALKSAFPVPLAAGDYIEIMVQHATAAGAIEGGTGRTAAVLSMKRTGPV